MILSYKHKFIFMHVPKAAGSSITVHLAKHMGAHDIQVGVWPERIEAGIHPNWRFYSDMAHPWCASRLLASAARGRSNWKSINAIHKRRYDVLVGERTAPNVKKAFPNEWLRYLKFAVVRNPFDRWLSQYHWLKVSSRGLSYSQFLEHVEANDYSKFPRMIDPWEVISIDGEIVMDRIARFESLGDDMATICEEIGIPYEKSSMPRVKVGKRLEYRDHHTLEDRARVERISAQELEVLGYEF